MSEKNRTNPQAGDHDISIIRPALRLEDIRNRNRDNSPEKLRAVKKALRTLHTLELMAQTIYKFQITKEPSEFNRQLTAAMCNEMTHYQDYQVKLYEYGLRPGIFRSAYWLVGFAFGFGSRLLGRKAMLKTGIWAETKAVHHYGELLNRVDWDEDCRRVIEKNQADEHGHINRWRALLESL